MAQDASWTPSKLGQMAREAQEEGCEVDDDCNDGDKIKAMGTRPVGKAMASCRLHDATINLKDRVISIWESCIVYRLQWLSLWKP